MVHSGRLAEHLVHLRRHRVTVTAPLLTKACAACVQAAASAANTGSGTGGSAEEVAAEARGAAIDAADAASSSEHAGDTSDGATRTVVKVRYLDRIPPSIPRWALCANAGWPGVDASPAAQMGLI